jgi:hypothetical protein
MSKSALYFWFLVLIKYLASVPVQIAALNAGKDRGAVFSLGQRRDDWVGIAIAGIVTCFDDYPFFQGRLRIDP